jgi:murein DD-endopeptidase MepM/ murein hydrolase activator NlpD
MGGLSFGSRSALVAILVLAACSHPAPPPAPPPPQPTASPPTPIGVHHTLLPGETLWRISRSYGVAVEAVARANAIADVHRIAAGTRLFIPGGRDLRGTLPDTEQVAIARDAGLEFAWPLAGRVTSGFGGRRRHDGIDVSAARGTLVRAAEAGEVVYSGSGFAHYGNLVVVRHSRDYATAYAHNRRNRVARGDRVSRGDVIAEVGTTGNASGPHLHFEVRYRDRPADPLRYLPRPVELVERERIP